jgi:hypothetical protein
MPTKKAVLDEIMKNIMPIKLNGLKHCKKLNTLLKQMPTV